MRPALECSCTTCAYALWILGGKSMVSTPNFMILVKLSTIFWLITNTKALQSNLSCPVDESETVATHSADRSSGIQTIAYMPDPASKAASRRPHDAFPAARCKRARPADRPPNGSDSWNSHLSNEYISDDERRRIRNREYQRRFREKKIRREQQRLSMATSSAYAFGPHSHLEY